MNQIIQTLKICLRGGQVIEIPFRAEKADELNPQIRDFIKAYGDEKKKEGKFVFQGQRMVVVRLADVSSADIVSLVMKSKESAPAVEETKEAEAPEAEEKKESAKKKA